MLLVANVAALANPIGGATLEADEDPAALCIVNERLRSRRVRRWVEADGGEAEGAGAEPANSVDPVDELLGRLATRSSRLFIRAMGRNFGDGFTGGAGEFGGVSTSIGTGGLARGEPSSPNWFG